MYWTLNLNTTSFASIQAAQLYFGSGGYSTMSYDRQIGMNVRPVFNDVQPGTSKDYPVDGVINGHDYVDLGLSVKWATTNVGATNPRVGGDLFSWGETEVKDVYTPETGKYHKNGRWNVCTKYNKTDGLTTLDSSDDAASVHWGDEWRCPTIEEWHELLSSCDWSSDGNNGIVGISKVNGKKIILSRSTGCKDDDTRRTTTEGGHYWSSSVNTTDFHRANAVICDNYLYTTCNINRFWGLAIRPVTKETGTSNIDRINNQSTSKNGIYNIKGKLFIKVDNRYYNINGVPLK